MNYTSIKKNELSSENHYKDTIVYSGAQCSSQDKDWDLVGHGTVEHRTGHRYPAFSHFDGNLLLNEIIFHDDDPRCKVCANTLARKVAENQLGPMLAWAYTHPEDQWMRATVRIDMQNHETPENVSRRINQRLRRMGLMKASKFITVVYNNILVLTYIGIGHHISVRYQESKDKIIIDDLRNTTVRDLLLSLEYEYTHSIVRTKISGECHRVVEEVGLRDTDDSLDELNSAMDEIAEVRGCTWDRVEQRMVYNKNKDKYPDGKLILWEPIRNVILLTNETIGILYENTQTTVMDFRAIQYGDDGYKCYGKEMICDEVDRFVEDNVIIYRKGKASTMAKIRAIEGDDRIKETHNVRIDEKVGAVQ
jgi:hypothetical protein